MKRNSSKPKRRYGDAGFTLVELVVVIAVLAILAGVGAVAYTGYIEYAKKGQDRATVGEIMHALELADYNDPTLFGERPRGCSVVLSSNGTVGSNTAVQKALNDAGINATLNSEKWIDEDDEPDAKSIKENVLNAINTKLSYLGQTGLNGKPVEVGYADIADDCWNAVRGVAEVYVNNPDNGLPEDYEASIVLYAAQKSATSDGQLNWSDFTMEWGSADDLSVLLPVVVARNYSFAAYLEKYGNYEGVKDDIVSLRDFAKVEKDKGQVDYLTTTDWSKNVTELSKLAQEYMKTEVYTGKSQAQIDSEGYYTFMSSMYNQYKGQTETDEKGYPVYKGSQDTFWANAGSLISTAAQLTTMTQEQRQAIADALPESGAVILVIIDRDADGRLTHEVFPASAEPVESVSGAGEGETPAAPAGTTTNVTLDFSSGTAEFHTAPDDGIIAVNSGTNTSISTGPKFLPGAVTENGRVTVDGKKITKIDINGSPTERTDTLQRTEGTATLTNGSAKVTLLSNGGASISLTGGSAVGTSCPVTITYTFEDNTTQTISFTFWVI